MTNDVRNAYQLTLKKHHMFIVEALNNLIREHLQVSVQDLKKRAEEEDLNAYTDFSDVYTVRAGMVGDVFNYHDRIAPFKSPEYSSSDIIFRAAWDEYFYPQVQHQIRFLTWKMYMISSQSSILQHDLARQAALTHRIPINPSSSSGNGLHAIYLATCPLNQRTPTTLTWTASCHWGLVLARGDGSQWLLEITKTGVGQLVGIPQPKPFQYEKSSEWNLMASAAVGYTFLGRNEIHTYATELRRAYKLLSDNCQTFCEKLLECIRIPLDSDDVFRGLGWAPASLSQAIIYRRCRDFEKLAVLRQLGMIPPTECLPIGIQVIFPDSVLVLIELGIFLRSVTLAVLLLAAIFTFSQYGNVPLVNQLVRLAIRPEVDTLRLIYSELYPQAGLGDEEREELPTSNTKKIVEEG